MTGRFIGKKPAATDTAYIDILTRRVRELMQETLRVLTVATQIVFIPTCLPLAGRSEGTQATDI